MTSPAHILTALYATLDRMVTDEFNHLLTGSGLSRTQYNALRYLRHQGQAELAELAGALLISAPAASKLADRLEGGGWARRQGLSTDRRRTAVLLTEQARSLLASMDSQVSAVLGQVFERLDPDEQKQLLAGTGAFLQVALQDMPEVGRPCLYCGDQHADDCPLYDVRKRP